MGRNVDSSRISGETRKLDICWRDSARVHRDASLELSTERERELLDLNDLSLSSNSLLEEKLEGDSDEVTKGPKHLRRRRKILRNYSNN